MALDYRTPRRPKRPEPTDGMVFARYPEWTVQARTHEGGKFIVLARRKTWSAAYEWALGYADASKAAMRLGELLLVHDGLVVVVGPDHEPYAFLQAGDL